jgi:MazG family protein
MMDAPDELRRIDALLAIMARLRDPQHGCPWDLEQTFASIAPYTLEEAYEVADAIERDDLGDLKDELGDLLLQVVFHSQMAAEARAFSFADVVEAICTKMIRRHPHVFGDEKVANADAQTTAWEEHKRQERAARGTGDGGLLGDVPMALPALVRALKLQKRAASVGFDWRERTQIMAKLSEEISELNEAIEAGAAKAKLTDELGDILPSSCGVLHMWRRPWRRAGANSARYRLKTWTRPGTTPSGLSQSNPALTICRCFGRF